MSFDILKQDLATARQRSQLARGLKDTLTPAHCEPLSPDAIEDNPCFAWTLENLEAYHHAFEQLDRHNATAHT